jgi:hypothetical protein
MYWREWTIVDWHGHGFRAHNIAIAGDCLAKTIDDALRHVDRQTT